MRYFIFAVLTFLCFQCLANTKEFDSKTAKEYLSNSKAVLLVHKLDGNLHPYLYEKLLQGAGGTLSQDEIFELWKINTRDSIPNRFLVLKSYSGDYKVGSYIYANEHSSYPEIIGRDDVSLVFFRESKNGKLNFTLCRVVTSEYLSESFFTLKTKNEVIEYVIEQEPNLCFGRTISQSSKVKGVRDEWHLIKKIFFKLQTVM